MMKPRSFLLRAVPAASLCCAAAAQADRGDEWAYPIARGDTLIAIAATHLTEPRRWPELQKLNEVRNPRRLVPGSSLRIPLAWMRSEAASAEVVYARGEARVQAPGESASSAARQGQKLAPGTLLETGADSSLALRLADGTRLLVAPGSRATLEELREYRRAGLYRAQLELQRGSVESQVTPSRSATVPYKVRTPVATLGVRGTDFRAHAAAARAGVEVLSGAVAAAAGEERRVEAGFGTFARAGGGVASPRELLPAPLLPAVPPTPTGGQLRLAWSPVGGAMAYRAQLFADDDSLLREARTDQPVTAWDDLPQGRYRLRVRAVDVDGIEGLDAQTGIERTAAAPPPPPTWPLPPLAGAPYAGNRVTGPTVSFAWAVRENGRRYRLQVADEPGFARPQADLADDAAPAVALVQREVGLTPGRWWWRVATLGDDGRAGPFSEPVPFEVAPAGR